MLGFASSLFLRFGQTLADRYRLISAGSRSVMQSLLTRVLMSTDMNIYVGNLPYNLTDDDLRGAFSQFGEVSSVNIITDKFSGQSKGFGFVEMPNNSEADEAIKVLNGSALKGRSIKVNQAKPRGERVSRKPRY
jgi:RNA recognition motif-containing protein